MQPEPSRLSDGVTSVTLLAVEDGTENPLPSLAAYRHFQETLGACMAEAPVSEPDRVFA